MARVLLIQAAVHDTHIERGHPLGLMCLASYLRQARGDEIRLHDMRLNWKRLDLPLQAFREFRPDAVGISAHGVDAPAMHEVARRIKELSPQTPVVAGGIHATSYWAEVLRDPHIDAVVLAEGEVTLREWLDAREQGRPPEQVPGLAVRANGHAVQTAARPFAENLDDFPFPAWDLVDLDAYGRFPRAGIFYRSPRYMAIETARGCPFRCAWCHRSMGNRFRPHSVEYVLGMIDRLLHEYRVDDFLVVDDMFNFDADRIDRLFAAVRDRGWRVGFSLPIGIRADIISRESLALMRQAGVYKVMIAVETASPRLQKTMGKNLDLDRTQGVIRQAADLGISTHGNFMIGLPTETPDEMWRTLRFAARSHLDTFGLYRAIPFKGTELHEMAVAQQPQAAPREDTYSFWDLEVNLSSIPRWKLTLARRVAYPYFYLRLGRLWRLFAHLPNRARLIPFLLVFFVKKLFTK